MGTMVVVGSAAVNAAHTVSHAGQHVMSLPAWQLACIVVVIMPRRSSPRSCCGPGIASRGRGCSSRRWRAPWSSGSLPLPPPRVRQRLHAVPRGVEDSLRGSPEPLLPLQGKGCLAGCRREYVVRVRCPTAGHEPVDAALFRHSPRKVPSAKVAWNDPYLLRATRGRVGLVSPPPCSKRGAEDRRGAAHGHLLPRTGPGTSSC